MSDIRFSLIMATLGRKEEVEFFFKSLIVQSYKNFELIVVDQNSDDHIKNLCKAYNENFDIKYIYSEEKGLSKARNKGLKIATGNVIAFPDDDCEYERNILLNVIEFFKANEEYNIVTFKSIDMISGRDSNNIWAKENCDIGYKNIFETCTSYTIFIKTMKKSDVVFDERLGVGAYFGSAEECDMVFNLLHKGYKGRYIKDWHAYHPIKEENKNRYYNYALGLGAFAKKEVVYRKNYSYAFQAIEYVLFRPIGGMIVSIIKLNKNSLRKYCYVFVGRVRGFIEYKISG